MIEIKRLGTPDQLGFLSRDLKRSATQWADEFGVGPFFHTPLFDYAVTYRGTKSELRLQSAFSFLGDTQIQLMVQLNDSPSVFTEFRDGAGPEGLLHLAFYTTDPVVQTATFKERGARMVQTGGEGTAFQTAYFDGMGFAGAFLELIGVTNERLAAKQRMRQAVYDWNGSDLHRDISSL